MDLNEMNRMIVRRLCKGQIEKIRKFPNWKDLVKNAINYVYNIIGVQFELDKVKIILLEKNEIKTHEFTTRNLNDSRLANNQSLIMFIYRGVLYHMAFDHNRLKIMLTKCETYSVKGRQMKLRGVDKPFDCIQANMDGELDPRPWKGVPCVKQIVFTANRWEK